MLAKALLGGGAPAGGDAAGDDPHAEISMIATVAAHTRPEFDLM
jgi:hypothetical protein